MHGEFISAKCRTTEDFMPRIMNLIHSKLKEEVAKASQDSQKKHGWHRPPVTLHFVSSDGHPNRSTCIIQQTPFLYQRISACSNQTSSVSANPSQLSPIQRLLSVRSHGLKIESRATNQRRVKKRTQYQQTQASTNSVGFSLASNLWPHFIHYMMLIR